MNGGPGEEPRPPGGAVPDWPEVSVVVPVYNGAGTIRACLGSLIGLTYPAERREIIVVDNGSTDGTADIVGEYPVRLEHERAVRTSYAARNRGIAVASGEVVAFTDADCVAEVDWLVELTRPFARPNVGVVGGRVLDGPPQNDVERFIANLGLFSRYEGSGDYLPVVLAGSTAYRAALLRAVGGFNQRLYTGADVDLGWRVQLATGCEVAYAPRAIVHHLHRSTVRGMARQFRRHGFGELLLDAMYWRQPGYRRSPRRQLARMARQTLALGVYARSAIYRWMTARGDGAEPYYVREPRYWLVAEASNLRGKLDALWYTRLFTRDPSRRQLEDPR